jgi:glycerol-3-phosphate dehydrogenase
MQYLSARRDDIPAHVPIVSTSKGLHSELLLTMNEIIPQALGREQPCAFLSGPSFAKEIMRDMPTAVVVASSTDEVAARVQALYKSDRMRVYTCKDVIGVEVGGALKNVFAIACGIAEGCGLGYNSAAALVTRGLSEMRKLALSMGAQEQTLSGLSGQAAFALLHRGTNSHFFKRCRRLDAYVLRTIISQPHRWREVAI